MTKPITPDEIERLSNPTRKPESAENRPDRSDLNGCMIRLQDAQTMVDLEPGSFDHVITDPPYSPSVHAQSRRGLTDYKERKGAAAREARTRDLGFDGMTPELMLSTCQGMAHCVRRWALVFCDVELAQVWRFVGEASGLEYVRTLFWAKLGATPQLTGDRPASHVEAIMCFHQRKPDGKPMRKRWNGAGKGNVYRIPICLNRGHQEVRFHTTQKPLALMLALVRDFTQDGESILDPFAGSGTTVAAAKRLGRVAEGWDIDDTYVQGAMARVGQTSEQMELAL